MWHFCVQLCLSVFSNVVNKCENKAERLGSNSVTHVRMSTQIGSIHVFYYISQKHISAKFLIHMHLYAWC